MRSSASSVAAVLAVLFVARCPSAQAALVISSDPTSNVTCGAGVCSATAADAVLNAADLVTLLGAGALEVQSGSDAMDIAVTAPVTWAKRHALTLTANRSITVAAPLVAEVTGARVALVTGAGGELAFTTGRLDFWSTHSHLTINGVAYKLVDSLSALAAAVAAHPPASFALTQSYDAGPDGTYAHAPVSASLKGSFEGLGHTVSNLSISSSDNDVGLFAKAIGGASLRNLALANVAITSFGDHQEGAGALLGFGDGVTVSHIVADGSLSGDNIGGVVGRLMGTLSDSSAAATIDAAAFGGGLVATMTGTGSAIARSHASGNVSGGGAGGLVGSAMGNITASFATGTASGQAWGGGLVGYFNTGTIQTSFATGNVSAADVSRGTAGGGLVGFANHATIRNVYALGNVSVGPDGYSGGLIGHQSDVAFVDHSYAAGTVSGGHANQKGGFAGAFDFAQLSVNYWDVTTGGAVPKYGIGKCAGTGCKSTVGLTTTQLQSGVPAGFDTAIWAQDSGINGGFPYLLAVPPS